ncbi:hypothetical protein [Terasakiella sp.]|uniref:hypothetical protein n=1 Tax=Terasakiella sp. TaxID=2034861 RepID=UPI003AA7EBA8
MSKDLLKKKGSSWISQAIFEQVVTEPMKEEIRSNSEALDTMKFEVSFQELSYLMGMAYLEGGKHTRNAIHQYEADLK